MSSAAVAVATTPTAAVDRVAINKWAIAAAVALGALLEVVDTSIVNVALTDMQSSLRWARRSSRSAGSSPATPSPTWSSCR
jgi:hypothetical protein